MPTPHADSPRDIPGIVAPPPLLYAVPFVAGIVLQRLWPIRLLPPAVARVTGPLLLLLGCVGFVALWTFRRARTSPNPWHATRSLVTTGPYRVSRNPMYLGFTLLYLGGTAWVNSLWPLLFLPVILVLMHRGVITREEAYLARKFPSEYSAYRTRVRRWL